MFVHTMVRLYLLSVLVLENLAEHLLLELAARLSDSIDSGSYEEEDQNWMWDMSRWSDDEVKSMTGHIVVLMDAVGESKSEEDMTCKCLPELLQVFVVGTERRKTWKQRIKMRPKPSELGPISAMKFMSTARRARMTMRRDIK